MWTTGAVAVALVAAMVVVARVARHRADDVTPTVQDFADFRAALSRHVDAVEVEARFTARHLDRRLGGGTARS